MANCECLPGCPFFNDKMAEKPATANIMKKKYCLGDNSECARYIIFKSVGKEHVPSDLFPSQHERINKIIEAIKK
jgi:hypothetical protein